MKPAPDLQPVRDAGRLLAAHLHLLKACRLTDAEAQFRYGVALVRARLALMEANAVIKNIRTKAAS